MYSPKLWSCEKRSFTKKISESFEENWGNEERFSKFSQFCKTHFFYFSVPPSTYALNLKALIKVSKVSWTFQLSYLDLHLKENLIKKLHFSEKTLPKSLQYLGLSNFNSTMNKLDPLTLQDFYSITMGHILCIVISTTEVLMIVEHFSIGYE